MGDEQATRMEVVESGRITIDWTRLTDGTFDWDVGLEGKLKDAEIEALLTEIAQRF